MQSIFPSNYQSYCVDVLFPSAPHVQDESCHFLGLLSFEFLLHSQFVYALIIRFICPFDSSNLIVIRLNYGGVCFQAEGGLLFRIFCLILFRFCPGYAFIVNFELLIQRQFDFSSLMTLLCLCDLPCWELKSILR